MNAVSFRRIVFALVAIALVSLPGCGGGISQSDMMKNARKKKSDEELEANVGVGAPAADESASAAAATTPTPPVANTAAAPAPAAPAPAASSASAPTAVPVAATPAAASPAVASPVASPVAGAEPKVVPDATLPAAPKTLTEQRQRTINNLTAIGKGLERYREKNGCYPPQAVYNASGAPILSWRVLLLPYLGYDDLYKRFRLDDYWDGSANEALVDEIPPCYQSPERLDKKTNYLYLTGPGTAFADNQGPRPEQFRDGVSNTILVVEGDEEHAAEWSKPLELTLDPAAPRNGIRNLRSDGFFAVWGGGKVFRMPADAPDNLILAAASPAGDEPLVAALVGRAANPEPDTTVKPFVPSPEGTALAGGEEFGAQPTGFDPSGVAELGGSLPGASGIGAGGGGAGGVEVASSGGFLPPPGTLLPSEVASGDLFEKSKASLAAGKEIEALTYLYAAAITNAASQKAEASPLGEEASSAPGWERDVKWIPALRKPAFAVRWGIGVRYAAPNNLQQGPSPIGGETKTAPPKDNTDPRKEIDFCSGEFGLKFVKELEARLTDGRMGNWLRESAVAATSIGAGVSRSNDEEDNDTIPLPAELAARPRGGAAGNSKDAQGRDRMKEERFLPGLLYFGPASDRVLLHLARRQQLEVLAVIDVEVRALRTGFVSNDCYIELIDAESGKSLYRTPTLNNIKVEQERNDRTVAEDPVEGALNRLFDYVATNLDMAPIPAGLKAEHAGKRVDALLLRKYDNPLPALAEICYYRRRELISDQELAKAAIELLGERADRLLDGQTSAERAQALADWLAEGQRRRQARLVP